MARPIHALVIDDHIHVIESVRERLESLGHTCDVAMAQDEAEALLEKRTFDYILLDLAIPLTYRGATDRQFGENLLHRILAWPQHSQTPVIIMTANDLKSYHLAVRLLKEGAADFVGKPFGPENPLEQKILEALGKKTSPSGKPRRDPVAPVFSGATIEFLDDRVEINGCKLTGRQSQARAVLECLNRKRIAGGGSFLGGLDIADQCGFGNGEKAAADAVRQIRTKACEILARQGLSDCKGSDIIANDDKGYRLGNKIMVRDSTGGRQQRLTRMQSAVLAQISKHPGLSRPELARLTGLPVRSLNGEIDGLLQRGLLKKSGNGKAMKLVPADSSDPCAALTSMSRS